eukprot:SAG22_NODE_1590_length_4048_cov_3.816156_4_plen_28_part_01
MYTLRFRIVRGGRPDTWTSMTYSTYLLA